MKFGSVDNPENIDFTLPIDHIDTLRVLNKVKDDNLPEIIETDIPDNNSDSDVLIIKSDIFFDY